MGSLVPANVADAAAALHHATSQVRAGEVAQALSIASLCDLHRVDETVLVAGAERWVPGGADGTPHIGEFIAGEIAALLGVSIGSAFAQIARVLNVRHRHPTLWRLFVEGDVRWWDAARVADAAAAAQLDAAACARLDQLCAQALALHPWARVRSELHRWILLADPARAALNQQAAADRRYVRLGGIEHGHVGLWGQLDAADGIALEDALNAAAADLDTEIDVQHRRAAALGVLARQALGQERLPGATARTADLVVRLDGTEREVASIDHWGHVLLPQLKEILADCTVRVRPVVVGSHLPAVDGYQVPESMRLALDARSPVDVFPWGARSAASCQADHTVPYDHRNALGTRQTRLDNLGPLSSFTHRLKTHGGWALEQPHPGTYRWCSPLGYRYEVTAAGTVRIGRPPPGQNAWWTHEPPTEDPPDVGLFAPGEEQPNARPDPGPRQTPLPLVA